MPTAEELEATVQAKGRLLGVDVQSVVEDVGATIRPHESAPAPESARAVDALLELVADTATLDREKLALHGTLGEGGMGVVRLGTQKVLGREVAIKTLKEGYVGDHWTLKLLREAWVTGGLEHPNVAPVYDIALGPDRTPLVVLKKIEGDDWASLMDDAAAVRDRFGAEDLLEWNLATLVQVCHAVHFAHSRQIVHRDIKPENVRIGTFGEVYLLDWGIAVSLEDDGSGRLPLASDAKGMAGTPAYMAPEMLGGPEDRITERTDVYLLGAVLFRLATGRPPHRYQSWHELLASVCRPTPDVPPEVPEELAAIIARAMAVRPADRFESADALRRALVGFLAHRGAARLAERAGERLAELTRLSMLPAEETSEEHHDAMYRLFAECRFGFRHALEVWPENERAQRGLEAAIVHMVGYELDQGHPRAARALLGELEAVPPDLAARVAEAERSRAAEDARLEQLRADSDLGTGRRMRAFVGAALGTGFVVAPAYAYLRHFVWHEPVDPWFGLWSSLAVLALLVVLYLPSRGSLMRTWINRQLALGGFLGIAASVLAHLATILGGLPLWEPLHAAQLAWALITAATATTDWRLFVPAAAYAVGYLVVGAVGREHVLLSVTATNLVLLVTVVLVWARPQRRRGRPAVDGLG